MHPFVNLAMPDGAVAIHWFEQSSFALKNTQGKIALIDPYFPHARAADRFIHGIPPVEGAALPAAIVILTHDHTDHTHTETLLRVKATNPAVQMIGPVESIRRVIDEVGLPKAQTQIMVAGETISLAGYDIHVVYAKPPAGDPGANIQPPDVTHLGYVIESGGRRLYFSGDPINNFAQQTALVAAVAAHQPELGFMTTHPTEGEFPFFPDCVKIAQQVGLKYAVPVHRACFVKRDYDPAIWAGHFSPTDPQPIIMPCNSQLIFTGTFTGIQE